MFRLILPGNSTEEDKQVGVVSWGLGCGHNAFPGVYARISAEYEWIRESVCEMSADPPGYMGCSGEDGSAGFWNPNQVDWTRPENMVEITLAFELDEDPMELGWVLEEDPELSFKVSSAGRTAHIEGVRGVPFDTYTQAGTIVTQLVQVAPGEQYRLTLLDRGANGLHRKKAGEVDQGVQRQRRFRMCYGSISGLACINAPLASEEVICSEYGNFKTAKSVSCFVDDIRPLLLEPIPDPTPVPNPTPKPQNLPTPFMLDIILDDDRLKPTPKPTQYPSISPNPSISPTTKAPTWAPITNSPVLMEVTPEPTLKGSLSPTKVVPLNFLAGTAIEGLENRTKAPTYAPTIKATKSSGSNGVTWNGLPAGKSSVADNATDNGVANAALAAATPSSSIRTKCAVSTIVAMAVSAVYFML